VKIAPLVLVPFASPVVSEDVRSTLCALGYEPRMLPPAEGLSGAMDGWRGGVVFLLGSTDCSRDRIVSALDDAGSLPSLCLIVNGESGWDRHLIDHCCDCAHWPCSSGELSFRLERLCSTQAAVVSVPMDQELANILAQLNLIGRSPAFLDAMEHIRRLVRCDATVLIEGETGTGKELVARAIHYLGAHADGPFVPVNCGALPDHLVENELFGHERGAYTDAKGSVLGAIGEAAGGTLFLDEVEALSPKTQAALLRFLQDREYRPLGGRRARRSDARVVAATNADLRALCDQRAFRADLFFRLEILSIVLPPLRDRAGDVEVLTSHFIEMYRQQYASGPLSLDPRSMPSLLAYPWPGNVRELENLVHRAVLMADGRQLLVQPGVASADGVAPTLLGNPEAPDIEGGFAAAKARVIQTFERSYLTRLMAETNGNVTQAARLAAKERRALGKLLRKHGILSNRSPA
jgi:DNA-binding NtrC family response regulator